MRTLAAFLCFTFAVLLFGAWSAGADENQGLSFDCDKASTPTEYAICVSGTLSALDRGLAAAYKVAQEQLDEVSVERKELLAERRIWHRELSSTCGDNVECLIRNYQERILRLPGERAITVKPPFYVPLPDRVSGTGERMFGA